MRLRLAALLLSAALLPAAAWAETCKYTDSDGRIIYSNTPKSPPKDAKLVKCFADLTPPPPADAKGTDASAPNKPAPRVTDNVQKKRDDDRRRILEQELADENRQLEEARKELAAQEAIRNGNERNYARFLERVQPYQEAVKSHERNIESLTREIANLK